jgi:hypothetical protein
MWTSFAQSLPYPQDRPSFCNPSTLLPDRTFSKTFTGQIIINSPSSAFAKGGDSGSLVVQDIGTNPRAVGLLFAGNSTTAAANPIARVLGFLGATMVGN